MKDGFLNLLCLWSQALYTHYLYPHTHSMGRVQLFIPIFQMRKLKFREVQLFVNISPGTGTQMKAYLD